MRPLFQAIVKDGKVVFGNRGRWLKWLEKLEGFEVDVWIDKVSFERTKAENAYYHAVIVEIVAKEMGLIHDDAHELLKSLFLKKGIEHKGVRYEIIGSTKKLKINQFEEYCEKCRLWGMEQGWIIPLPNEIILEK